MGYLQTKPYQTKPYPGDGVGADHLSGEDGRVPDVPEPGVPQHTAHHRPVIGDECSPPSRQDKFDPVFRIYAQLKPIRIRAFLRMHI